MAPNAAPHDLGEIVGSALRRAGKILARPQVSLRARRRPADARARSGAVRAGAVQPARQRRQVRAGRHHDRDPRAAATATSVSLQVADEGDGIPPDELEQRLRQVLPRAEGRPGPAPAPASASRSRAASSRPWAARIIAANRTDRPRRRLHRPPAGPGARPRRWIPPHERAPDQDPRHRRRAADPQAAAHGARHAGLRRPRGGQRQGGAGAARAKARR